MTPILPASFTDADDLRFMERGRTIHLRPMGAEQHALLRRRRRRRRSLAFGALDADPSPEARVHG